MFALLKAFTLTALASLAVAAPQRLSNGDCSPQPIGVGPAVTPDTPEDFQSYWEFSKAAQSAITPSGYVQSYQNLNSTYNDPALFAGYRELTGYDVQECAAACDSTSTCNAFTIFAERNPLQAPGSACPNPAGTTRIKCGLWQGTITSKMPLNHGQYQQDFHVVMAGSNAYVKEVRFDGVSNILGFTTDIYKDGGAIQAPLDCYGNNTYLGFKKWTDGKFDAQRCVDACLATQNCHFANTYFMRDDGVPFAQHCSLYTVHWPAWYATNEGQYVGGDEIEINSTKSYGFTVAPGKFEACEPVIKLPGIGLSV